MPRIFIWISRAVVITLALALVGAGLVNAYDPPLRPEVERLLAAPATVSDQARRAYFFVLGVTAGEKTSPEAAGAALWEKRAQPGFWAPLVAARPWSAQGDFHDCRPDDACTVASLARDPHLTDALSANADLVRSYTKLMEYGEGATLEDAPVSGLPSTGHALFLLQLAQWQRQGGQARVLDVLASSNAFMQSYLRRGNLFERMIAALRLRDNRRFARALKVSLPDELERSFASAPATAAVLEGAAEVDLRYADALLRGRGRADGETMRDYLVRRFLARPNETVNLYYEALQQLMASDCPPQMEITLCLPMLRFSPAAFFVNPVGKQLVRQMAESLHGYRPKMRQILNDVRASGDE